MIPPGVFWTQVYACVIFLILVQIRSIDLAQIFTVLFPRSEIDPSPIYHTLIYQLYYFDLIVYHSYLNLA